MHDHDQAKEVSVKSTHRERISTSTSNGSQLDWKRSKSFQRRISSIDAVINQNSSINSLRSFQLNSNTSDSQFSFATDQSESLCDPPRDWGSSSSKRKNKKSTLLSEQGRGYSTSSVDQNSVVHTPLSNNTSGSSLAEKVNQYISRPSELSVSLQSIEFSNAQSSEAMVSLEQDKRLRSSKSQDKSAITILESKRSQVNNAVNINKPDILMKKPSEGNLSPTTQSSNNLSRSSLARLSEEVILTSNNVCVEKIEILKHKRPSRARQLETKIIQLEKQSLGRKRLSPSSNRSKRDLTSSREVQLRHTKEPTIKSETPDASKESRLSSSTAGNSNSSIGESEKQNSAELEVENPSHKRLSMSMKDSQTNSSSNSEIINQSAEVGFSEEATMSYCGPHSKRVSTSNNKSVSNSFKLQLEDVLKQKRLINSSRKKSVRESEIQQSKDIAQSNTLGLNSSKQKRFSTPGYSFRKNSVFKSTTQFPEETDLTMFYKPRSEILKRKRLSTSSKTNPIFTSEPEKGCPIDDNEKLSHLQKNPIETDTHKQKRCLTSSINPRKHSDDKQTRYSAISRRSVINSEPRRDLLSQDANFSTHADLNDGTKQKMFSVSISNSGTSSPISSEIQDDANVSLGQHPENTESSRQRLISTSSNRSRTNPGSEPQKQRGSSISSINNSPKKTVSRAEDVIQPSSNAQKKDPTGSLKQKNPSNSRKDSVLVSKPSALEENSLNSVNPCVDSVEMVKQREMRSISTSSIQQKKNSVLEEVTEGAPKPVLRKKSLSQKISSFLSRSSKASSDTTLGKSRWQEIETEPELNMSCSESYNEKASIVSREHAAKPDHTDVIPLNNSNAVLNSLASDLVSSVSQKATDYLKSVGDIHQDNHTANQESSGEKYKSNSISLGPPLVRTTLSNFDQWFSERSQHIDEIAIHLDKLSSESLTQLRRHQAFEENSNKNFVGVLEIIKNHAEVIQKAENTINGHDTRLCITEKQSLANCQSLIEFESRISRVEQQSSVNTKMIQETKRLVQDFYTHFKNFAEESSAETAFINECKTAGFSVHAIKDRFSNYRRFTVQ